MRTAYSTPEGFTVSGGAIWVAGEEELTQVAGNEGKGKSFPFNVNNKVDQNDKKIKVVESYLNSEDLVVLKDDYIVKTYLLCYPIGNQLVATIHMSGARELSTEELDLLFVNNHELLRVANYLFRGDV
ncbi:hypothetical protein [Thalassobacillus sp. C254]|uniref:hypothetical protein n=1 Tax=Thalassobacillus sp. C254 TaxID=1225341 RepID=UPI0006D18603|nr:hypothetical protein [Thalassobacillus sp. C254]